MKNTIIHEKITDLVIQKLEEGVIPWRMPWKKRKLLLPKNLISDEHYNGVNIFLLIIFGEQYKSNYWITYKQAKEKGGCVKKGEKGTPIIYWNVLEKEIQNQKTEKIPFLKCYTVFNAEQCEGITYPMQEETETPFNEIETAEKFIANYNDKPTIYFGCNHACYKPDDDVVHMPFKTQFITPEGFYSTYFHELVHSTGHEERLKREGVKNPTYFGSHEYSKEELVAEMGAMILCTMSGIERKTFDNSLGYIKHWIEVLQNDKKMLILAGTQAQKAVDYIVSEPETEIPF